MTTTDNQSIRQTPLAVTFEVKADVSVPYEVFEDFDKFLSKNEIFGRIHPFNLNKLREYGDLSITGEKLSDSKAVVHFARRNAIVTHLEIDEYSGSVGVDKIFVDVGLLLYGESGCPVIESDVIAAHSIVIEFVSGIIHDPYWNSFRIFPKTWSFEDYFSESDECHYKELKASLILPGVNVKNLHFLCGSGMRPERISDNSIVCIHEGNEIILENVDPVPSSGSIVGPEQADDRSTRLTLILPFPEGSGDSADESRIFGVRHANIASRFHEIASSLGVVHASPPAGDRREEDVSADGAVIAMDMVFDGRLMDFLEDSLDLKVSTVDELRSAARSLIARCDTEPWLELLERAYARQFARAAKDSFWVLHPYVEAVVG